jgi:hypothetical protein
VHWVSWPGLAIIGGLALLGLTFFMVTSVLVPGVDDHVLRDRRHPE